MKFYRSESLLSSGRCTHRHEDAPALWIVQRWIADGTEMSNARCCRCKKSYEELTQEVRKAYMGDGCLLCLACDAALGVIE